MSTTYVALTFPVREKDLPPELRSFDDVLPFISSDVATGRTLISSSRNDWLASTVTSLAAHLGEPSLGFLVPTGRSPTKDRSGYWWFVSKLDSACIASAILGGERLLEYAGQNSEYVATLLDGEDAAQVLEALRSATPHYDSVRGPKGEEDGDGPFYLFAYLKSLVFLLRYVQEHGHCVIHAKHEHSAPVA